MAIREKLKAKFSSKNKTTTPSTASTNNTPSEPHFTGRTDIEYYKPHEIPKSKYRGRIDPVHQEKLDSFSFGETFSFGRRASAAMSGTFSPGGTKAFSRRTSYTLSAGGRTPARSRRSSLSSDANASFSIPNSESDSPHMMSIANEITSGESPLKENSEDDTDVMNAGLSKYDTVKADGNIPTIHLDRQATEEDKKLSASNNHIEHSSNTGMPFSPEELTQAMTRATISPPNTACTGIVAAA